MLRSLGVMVGGTLNVQWNSRAPDDAYSYQESGKMIPFCWFSIKVVLPPTFWQTFVMNLLLARTVITILIYTLGAASIVTGIVLMFHARTRR